MKAFLPFLLLLFTFVFIEKASGVSDAVNQLEAEKRGLLNEIKQTGEKAQKAHKTGLQLLSNLSALTEQLKTRREHIAGLDNEIKSLDTKMGIQSLELLRIEKNLRDKQEEYAKSIRKFYFKSRNQEKWLFLFSSQGLSQFYNRLRYLKEYALWRKIQGEELRIEREKGLELQAQLSSARKEKSITLGLRKKEKEQLDREEQQKKQLLSSVQKQEKELRRELEKKQQQARLLDQRIEQIIREEAEARKREQERLLRKAKEKKSNSNRNRTDDDSDVATAHSEGRNGYLMTIKERTLSSNFASNQGRLPIPIKGAKYRIVGHYGTRQHEQLKNITTNNSGVDLQTESGAQARSVFTGVVSRVFFIPGSGGSIIVRHGNYLTVYSNLSKIYVKMGDKVETRQPLGSIAPHPAYGDAIVLHFQIWKETTKLNPESWLGM